MKYKNIILNYLKFGTHWVIKNVHSSFYIRPYTEKHNQHFDPAQYFAYYYFPKH